MLIQAYQYLAKLASSIQPQAFHIFNKMAEEVCIGQRLDMDFENHPMVSITDYIQMITYKTSVLLAASLEIGALVAGASETDQHHLYEFGKNIGIAFQIQDDILDTYGSEAVGKKIGGDIIQNKKTYLYIKALELASSTQKSELLELYSSNEIMETDKIKKVRSIFDSCLVKEYAQQVMEAYRDLSVSHIHQLRVNEQNKQAMKHFADYLIMRNL
jgi:geranylgeranyl diphosphate synthase type II